METEETNQFRPGAGRTCSTRSNVARPEYRPDQRSPKQGSVHASRGRASQAKASPPDIFAEAVARAMQEEFEQQFVEVPAALRQDRARGFPVKTMIAVGAAALVALACAFYLSASDDSLSAALPSWQSLTALLSPEPEHKAAPTLVVQDSNGPINEPLLLGIAVSAAAPGASVTIDRMPAGSRLTTGKRMSASEWRVPAERVAEASVIPPTDFTGEMNLSATLRGADGAALVSSFVRLTWGEPAAPEETPAAANDAPIEPSIVLPTTPQREPPMAAQPVVSFAAPTRNISSSSPAADEPATTLPPNEIAYFLRRAQELIASGDVQAARLLLARAARAHDARAALLLAKSYDPNGYRQSSFGDPGSDLEQARNWYRKAREWGSPEAQRRLDALASYR